MSRLNELVAGASDGGWDHMDGWGGGWMWLFGIATMVLVVVLIAWLARTTAGGGQQSPPPTDPVDHARQILAERYARGELTTEEYRERIDQLG